MDVRRAAIEDVAEVGRLHVKTWQSAYRGEMPDAYLDGLSADDRAEMWRRLVEAGDKAAAALLVAEDDDGAIVGFACFGPSRNEQGAGWHFDGQTKTDDVLGATVREVRYSRDLAP